VNLGPFEQFLIVPHELEFAQVAEIVVHALDLAAAPQPRRDAYRKLKTVVAFQQVAGDGRLSRARRRGKHQHQAPAADALA
jgi:hypothetical protein